MPAHSRKPIHPVRRRQAACDVKSKRPEQRRPKRSYPKNVLGPNEQILTADLSRYYADMAKYVLP